jgi:hypothetical protein
MGERRRRGGNCEIVKHISAMPHSLETKVEVLSQQMIRNQCGEFGRVDDALAREE